MEADQHPIWAIKANCKGPHRILLCREPSAADRRKALDYQRQRLIVEVDGGPIRELPGVTVGEVVQSLGRMSGDAWIMDAQGKVVEGWKLTTPELDKLQKKFSNI